ncbi:MAG TPA: phosphohydrolase [Sporomusaceae bacterium]|nr:phosphohydrolase [Sporomusaceae bacterium]
MDMENIIKSLAAKLTSKRLRHSLGVSETARVLAERFGAQPEKARLAGLIHDCARELSNNNLLQMAKSFGIVISDVEMANPSLLHAPVGAYLAKAEFGIMDEQVLQAVKLHTTGGPAMTILDKVVFLADYIEPNRSFPGVDQIRNLAQTDLDQAVLAAYDQTLRFVIAQGGLIHTASVEGRNFMLLNSIKNE